MTRRVFSFLCGLKVSDTQTGLRGMSKRLMEAFLPVKGERFEYEMNMLIEADERQLPIREVPIETVYIEENRSSHFNPLLDSVRVYSFFTRFILSSLTSFCWISCCLRCSSICWRTALRSSISLCDAGSTAGFLFV